MEEIIKNILFDVQMGVAGDMFLASLADLAIECGMMDESEIRGRLIKSAAPMAVVNVEITRKRYSGISARGMKVNFVDKGHNADEEGDYDVEGKGEHGHISGKEMKEFLRKGTENAGVTGAPERYCWAVLGNIIGAEAKVHGASPDGLHLHETGAPDTLVEIIGSAMLLDRLGLLNRPNSFFSTPVSVGRGAIAISHGTVPVPAPATLEILKDMPFRFGPVKGEMATPTGVSLLKELRPRFIPDVSKVEIVPYRIGYGHGKRTFGGTCLTVVRAIGGSVNIR